MKKIASFSIIFSLLLSFTFAFTSVRASDTGPGLNQNISIVKSSLQSTSMEAYSLELQKNVFNALEANIEHAFLNQLNINFQTELFFPSTRLEVNRTILNRNILSNNLSKNNRMAFFKNKGVEAKYKNTNGDADPIIRVAIQYRGRLSEMPLNIADKVFADGGHIELNKDAPETIINPEKPNKKII